MGTKINQEFYGSEENFNTVSTGVKKSPYSLPAIITGDAYTGGALDYSAAPWGIGKSSVSNNFSVSIAKGAEWTYNENNRDSSNTPIFFYNTTASTDGAYNNAGLIGSSVTSYNYELALFRSRINPDTTLDVNNKFISSLTVDSGASVNYGGLQGTYPITYLDYQAVKAVIGHIYYKPVGENTIKKTTLDAIISSTVDVDSIVYFDFALYDGNSLTPVDASIGGNKLELLDVYKSVYYGDIDSIVSPARKIGRFGYWYIDEQWYNQDSFRYGPSDSYTYYQSEWDTLGNSEFIYPNPVYTGWSTLSGKQQHFNDVTYHWEYGITAYDNNQWNINKIENGDTYESNTYRSFAYLELDNYDGLSKNEAYATAIIHELAFLGLPVVSGTGHLSSEIGDNDVYVPVFDEHLITTGEYKSGADSLTLPNAEWSDIFGVDMPDYDPTYNPEDDPDNQNDRGDLINKGNKHYFVPASYNVYLLDSTTFYQFMGEIINYYNNLSPDDWTIDFQGVNPSDYIIAAYATQCWIPKSNSGSAMKLGKMSLSTTAYEFDSTKTGANLFTYGKRDIKPFYNNFRDYAPYTTLELYLPLCGTIELDTAYCMGHSITVDYCYDILTMSCTAHVYRDDLLYKTADGSIGSQIPLLSANMGAYQNQLAQYDAAKKQNNMRLFGAAATITAGIATAIGSGGVSLIPSAVAIGGGIRTAVNADMSNDLTDYQISHLAPSISQTGAADCQNGFSTGQLKPKLIIKRAKHLTSLNDEVYSHTVGNACCINSTIGSRYGLTVCNKIDTSGINATVEEIQAIKQAFANGVYV